jgi:HlyD family secretion protein
MSSDTTERPPRQKTGRVGDRRGVSELPWPEERGEREPEAREFRSDDTSPKTEPAPPEHESFWTRFWPLIATVFILLAIAGLIWWAIRPSEPKTTYTLANASIATITVTAHGQGRFAARDPVDVVAPTGARLASVAVKSGDHVRQGQILARLDSESAREAAVDQNAEIASSQSAVTRADADVTEARATLMRARNSTKAGEADTAEARLTRAIARANEMRALLAAAQTRLAAARAKMDGLVVRAPFDGIVLKSNLDTAEPVRTVARGQILFTLVRDLSTLDVKADFPESAVGSLHLGDRALLTVAAFPQRTFSATLNVISASSNVIHKEGDGDVNVYSGTLSAANSAERLRPGMTAEVSVILAKAKDVLTVPNTALMFRPPANVEAKYPSPKGAQAAPPPPNAPAPAESAPSLGPPSTQAESWSPVVLSSVPRPGRVWVRDGDTLKPRDIMVGLSDGKTTQVVSGELRAGDAVITSAIVQARSNANQS